MQRIMIVTLVLGLGTVLVFGAAAVTAAMFPNGATVATQPGWVGGWEKGGMAVPVMPMPLPEPAVRDLEQSDRLQQFFDGDPPTSDTP
jgi:hypothetical protein